MRTTFADCEQCETVVVEYLYDNLDPAARARVEGHLSSCANCRHKLEAYTQVRKAAEHLKHDEPADELTRRIREQALHATRGGSRSASWKRWLKPHALIPAVSLAAAGTLVLSVSLYVYRTQAPITMTPPRADVPAEQLLPPSDHLASAEREESGAPTLKVAPSAGSPKHESSEARRLAATSRRGSRVRAQPLLRERTARKHEVASRLRAPTPQRTRSASRTEQGLSRDYAGAPPAAARDEDPMAGAAAAAPQIEKRKTRATSVDFNAAEAAVRSGRCLLAFRKLEPQVAALDPAALRKLHHMLAPCLPQLRLHKKRFPQLWRRFS